MYSLWTKVLKNLKTAGSFFFETTQNWQAKFHIDEIIPMHFINFLLWYDVEPYALDNWEIFLKRPDLLVFKLSYMLILSYMDLKKVEQNKIIWNISLTYQY